LNDPPSSDGGINEGQSDGLDDLYKFNKQKGLAEHQLK